MAAPVLYSTNPWFTEHVCDRWRGGRYQLWCSEYFDPASHGSHSPAARTAPSSSPKPIYYDLLHGVRNEDDGNGRILKYRETFQRLAHSWYSLEEISLFVRDEILALIERYRFKLWEPRLFVIPRDALEGAGRLRKVPADKRSGIGDEFQIFDLRREEFDVIMIES